MNLITLTLNPAIDVHCQTATFVPFHENLAEVTSHDLGGKGINISRALHANGISSIPVILVGEENYTEFQEGLKRQLPKPVFFRAEGSVRENITLHSKEGETRISFRGFTAPKAILQQLQQYLLDFDLEQSVVTFTGSIPKGIEKEEAIRFLLELKKKGAKLVIDSKSITLEELLLLQPWLIKPNEEEIAVYAGGEISEAQLADKAKQLHRDGIEYVVISLGEKGALCCNGDAVYHAIAPKIEVRSTIGAGDSMIAGFLAAYAENSLSDAKQLLRRAVAYGTAACLTEGTLPPAAAEIEQIYKEIRISVL